MDQQITPESLIKLYQESLLQNWDLPLFSDYDGISYKYGEVAQKIHQIHLFYKASGIQKGDKIALLGRNSSNWGIVFLATLGYGAVAVPVLPDFNPSDVHHIVNHSESSLLFATDALLEKLDLEAMSDLKGIIRLNSFELGGTPGKVLEDAWRQSLKEGSVQSISPAEFQLEELALEDACVISYTSGTSGFTKGVMVPVRSLLSNIVFAREHMPLKSGDRIVSFLPMAHVFGLLFEFLFPATLGCHITFLTKAPTPQVIIKAFAEIKPRLILSVPLVIEKIYKKRIQPALEKPSMKLLLKVPVLSSVIRKKVREKLVETFGGCFHEIVIGGAPLSKEVEVFFRKIKFPFTIGYGMTECGPLISYDAWQTTQPSSAGKLVDRMQVRIDSDDPYRQVGEIQVKGMNTMLGYYKNEEATEQAFTEDGWLRTGDLGLIDSQNYIFIKGRSKNMLLGPSGQNIYPEEIEAKLANMSGVLENVVVEREGKLVALIFPDSEFVEAEQLDEEAVKKLMEHNRKHVNKELPKYSQVSRIEIVEEEFEKTPKRNIKRYLYTS
ncbi:long-chain acyl-CoA synthetase [Sunxiuqinia elliptica]|uniref:Long-chain acyl-CoA synthetase n=2 Tax=Sunxiuqinia elliptica TaxID=655355 RepID=A0A4R6H4C9_9BACT|nr:long-chain acyl-CoA synthetase [Sunxiuqinia elliptica]TDO58508.1 long-chain acyl-CoA synthetase [Sunxiuqinia elliptica]